MPRRGLSLVETLVVISILALLTGLTMSAVQRVRSSAARLQCQNHLRQLSLGLHQHSVARGALPTGISGKQTPTPFLGWHVRLLPFLEQSAMFDQAELAYRQDRNFLHDPPHVGLTQALPIFGCPTDVRTHTPQEISPGVRRGLTSYLGVEGRNSIRLDGVLFIDSTLKLGDVTDGTSNTIAIGERPPSSDFILGWWYAGWGQDQDGEAEMLLGTRTKNRYRRTPQCPPGPYAFAAGKLDNPCDAFHFWSLHSGGANFAFADGSVRFLSYSADSILPDLSTRAGGEVANIPD